MSRRCSPNGRRPARFPHGRQGGRGLELDLVMLHLSVGLLGSGDAATSLGRGLEWQPGTEQVRVVAVKQQT